MSPALRTPEGRPNKCPVCGKTVYIEASAPAGDAPCPFCGCLLWILESSGQSQLYGFHQFAVGDRSLCTKTQALTAILDRLVERHALPSDAKAGLLAALLRREELGSVSLGSGDRRWRRGAAREVCDIDRTIGALATFPAGVDFGAPDGQPVRRDCVLLSPVDGAGEHLRLLESVSRWLRASAS